MAKAIGPSFYDEVKAAGISFDGWSWNEAGKLNMEKLSADEQAAIQAVYDAHNPAKQEPDVPGFKLALFGIYRGDRIAVNDLNAKYPYFRDALDKPDWDGVKIVIEKALERTDITQEVYEAIKAVLPSFHLPVVLK